MVKIFIDPGHGGSDSGAVGNGLKEKNLTLAISKKIKAKLANYKGVEVKLSRDTDKTLALKQRTDMANAWGANYLISVHINAGGGTGFESYTYNKAYSGKQETNRLRSIIHGQVIQALGNEVVNRGEKEANLHMVRESSMPAILTENLFIDNAKDAAKLKQSSWIDRIAQGHVNGLEKAFGLKQKTQSKPAPEPQAGGTYKVKSGDTLWGISQKYGMTVNELKSLNGLTSDTIYPGQVLKVTGSKPKDFKVGQKVKIKKSASKYATGQSIPSWVKGNTYTIQQVKSDMVLLKDIVSWVYKKDVD